MTRQLQATKSELLATRTRQLLLRVATFFQHLPARLHFASWCRAWRGVPWRGVPAPSPGAHQRVCTRVCGDSNRTAAFPDGCTLTRCATCSQSRLQLSSLPSAQLSNEDVDTAITLSVFVRFTRESECRMSE